MTQVWILPQNGINWGVWACLHGLFCWCRLPSSWSVCVCVCVYICLCWYTSLRFGDGCAVVEGSLVCTWFEFISCLKYPATTSIAMCIFGKIPRNVEVCTEEGGVVKTIGWRRKCAFKWDFSLCVGYVKCKVFPLTTGRVVLNCVMVQLVSDHF